MTTGAKARYCVITPLGYRVLRALDRGTYKAIRPMSARRKRALARQRRAARGG